ncbi:magnesium transporter MgtE N-terminal domain-containing protein [Aeromonas salmonicida]|uniref:magnesium transporter MgtE N-terminal domain-containing protein n=2 Tax=Aeromonas salmonicida TaxID=645 RepID=UPI003D02F65E
MEPSQLNKLITSSNDKELSLLMGHLPEKGMQVLISNLNEDAANRLFSTLSNRTINKVLLLCSTNSLAKLLRVISRDNLIRVIRSTSSDVRDRLLKMLPIEDRHMILEIAEEESDLEDNYKHYLTQKFENSIEKDAFDRIKELEDKERYLERRQRAREEQLTEQLEHLRNQISIAEKDFHQRQNKLKSIESSFVKRELELKDSIRQLQDEYQKQVQEKIELKVPEFVKFAVDVLEKKENEFSKKSKNWNLEGSIALGLAILSAIGALIYGGIAFHSAAKENIDWFFFSFLLLKGLIVVTLFGAWAKHAYNLGNAYMHESLKRSDRMHAINFGKFYLEVYGNNVSQSDMKAIFENWNLNSDSAFTKVETSNFEPKIVEQVTQMITAVSNATNKQNPENKSK